MLVAFLTTLSLLEWRARHLSNKGISVEVVFNATEGLVRPCGEPSSNHIKVASLESLSRRLFDRFGLYTSNTITITTYATAALVEKATAHAGVSCSEDQRRTAIISARCRMIDMDNADRQAEPPRVDRRRRHLNDPLAQVGFTLPLALRERIDDVVIARRSTRSAVICEALREWLACHQDENPDLASAKG